jgi:hypothetical protein
VAEGQQRQALLGRLAAFGWFTQSGEVAATQAVGMLLEEPPLRHALLRRLAQITETDLASVALQFHAEMVHDDLARPDLEGRDGRGRPLVVIEGKFHAKLTTAQLQAYMTDQLARLTGGVRGALIVLVPSYRRLEAEDVLSTVGNATDERIASTPSVATAVLTWDDLLALWDDAAQELPADDQDAVLCDLRQLRALCKTMAALSIGSRPLGLVATGGTGWQEREGDLRRLVDEATASARDSNGRRPPIGPERWPAFEYYRRYMPGGLPDADCLCAVGVVTPLADRGTPFWLRYHWTQSSYQTVVSRIMASRYAVGARNDGGHIWLPLHVSADRSGATIVDELIEQIEAIRAVAAGAELPEAGPS